MRVLGCDRTVLYTYKSFCVHKKKATPDFHNGAFQKADFLYCKEVYISLDDCRSIQ